MTPEYIEELANIADPEQLWRLPALESLNLPEDKRKQLQSGVALRRHASHLRTLNRIREEGRSLLITPIYSNSTATMTVDTPPNHQRFRSKQGATAAVAEPVAADVERSMEAREPYRRRGDEMDLPAGKTCGDCVHVHRCTAMFGHIPADEVCDWSPSRFRAAASRGAGQGIGG